MSHRTIREPTDAEHAELKRMKREEIGRVAIRAHIVLLSHRGHSAQEIAELHDVTDPMVYKWIGRFDEEGPAGLYDQDREGRPPKIDEEAEAEIEKLLESDPTEHGENASRWTAPRIAEHLRNKQGIDVHPDTVRDALKRLEYSWTRPRRQLPSPANREEKMAQVRRRIDETSEETTILFADETKLKRFPQLRRIRPVGQQRARSSAGCQRRLRALRRVGRRIRPDVHPGLRKGAVRLHNSVSGASESPSHREGAADLGPSDLAHLRPS